MLHLTIMGEGWLDLATWLSGAIRITLVQVRSDIEGILDVVQRRVLDGLGIVSCDHRLPWYYGKFSRWLIAVVMHEP